MDTRFVLAQDQIPTAWYNALPDLPEPLQPPLHPGHEGAGRPRRSRAAVPDGAHRAGDDAARRRSTSRAGARHPAAVAADAARARPPARGGARHAGAHLLQGRVGLARGLAQAEHRGRAGVSTTRQTGTHAPRDRDRRRASGASALAFACAQFDLECKVYMVRASYEQKPYRRVLMETWGASVVPSPVDDPTIPGRSAPRSATRCATPAPRDDTHYSLGSVLNHVLLHQTIIGLEAKEQLALAGETRPDVVIGSLRRRLEPRWDRAAVHDRRRRCGCSRSSRRRARRSPGQVRLRLRRHRG